MTVLTCMEHRDLYRRRARSRDHVRHVWGWDLIELPYRPSHAALMAARSGRNTSLFGLQCTITLLLLALDRGGSDNACQIQEMWEVGYGIDMLRHSRVIYTCVGSGERHISVVWYQTKRCE